MSSKSKKEDSPCGEKNSRLSKGRNSFRFGKNKSSNVSRASGILGKTVQVKGLSSVEEIEKEQCKVFRALECSEAAIQKKLLVYLIGIPEIVLENVISLTREIDQMAHNTNSSELSSLMSHVYQTVADYGLWIDQYFLHGDKSHCDQSINDIVHIVREAVKSLVEFVINKENQNMSDSNFFHQLGNGRNESNNSFCSGDSPYSRKKLNETRNSHSHGSMPEIPSAAGGYTSSSLGRKTPPSNKLTYSMSSDSILENKENFSSSTAPSIYVVDGEGNSSCDESTAPPIPPKKNIKKRSSLRSSYNECDLLARQNSPYDSSFDDTETLPARLSAGLISCSNPHSLDYSLNYSLNNSSASSNDSILQASPNLKNSNTDRDSVRGSSSLGSINLNSRATDLTSMLSHNSELSSFHTLINRSNATSCASLMTNNINNRKIYAGTHSYRSFRHEEKSVVRDSVKETSTQTANVSRNQHTFLQSSRNSACSSSSRSSGSEFDGNAVSLNVPPPIPKKSRQRPPTSPPTDRAYSHYDNIDGIPSSDRLDFKHHSELNESHQSKKFVRTQEENLILCSVNSSTSELASSKSSVTSWESTTSSSCTSPSSVVHRRHNETCINHMNRCLSSIEKPPLPPKQKHILEYMRIFNVHEMPGNEWFANIRSQQDISSYKSSVISLADEFKDMKLGPSSYNSRLSLPNSNIHSPPALPPKRKSRSPDFHQITPKEISPHESVSEGWQPQEVCLRRQKGELLITETLRSSEGNQISNIRAKGREGETKEQAVVEAKEKSVEEPAEFIEELESDSLLDSLSVSEHIDFKHTSKDSDGDAGSLEKASADDLKVTAGPIDALVVYATYTKNGKYLEEFLTAYRTFLTPSELISKLFYRYNKFVYRSNNEYQKAAKNAFSLLARVVHDLVAPELTEELLGELSQFEFSLLAKGDLKLGLYFRKKLSEKLKLYKDCPDQGELSYHNVTTMNEHQYTFLDFKSSDIADQMTLLDSELFSKFGIPELLYYVRDQNEELCPNLAVFAMKINKMSTWVKTLILKSSSQDREKYYKKFIKIMKHLRKVNNNFNSCIAILSGLESTPVRRLDWPKTSTDMLKEYCDLFDFRHSYQTYRRALEETKPPCIPHLGMILQDLTKLYEVSPTFVDGKVNFQKCSVQFSILEDMKRFIPSKYNIRRNESIRHFINNYEDCMEDEELWELSLYIKPKKTKPK